jgi:hypothetical protein
VCLVDGGGRGCVADGNAAAGDGVDRPAGEKDKVNSVVDLGRDVVQIVGLA